VQYEVLVRQDPERGFFYPVVRRTAHSVATDTVLGAGFLLHQSTLRVARVGREARRPD